MHATHAPPHRPGAKKHGWRERWKHRLGIEDVQSHEVSGSLPGYGMKPTRWEKPAEAEHAHFPQKGLQYIPPGEIPALEKFEGIDPKAFREVYDHLKKTAFSNASISRGALEDLGNILRRRQDLNTTREEINRLRATVNSGYMYDPMIKQGFMTVHGGTSREGFSAKILGQKTAYRKLSSPTKSYFIKEPRILKAIPLFGPMFARYYSNGASALVNAVTFRSRRKRTVAHEINEALVRLNEKFEEEKNLLQRAERDFPKSTLDSFRETRVKYLREKAAEEKSKKAIKKLLSA